MSMINYFCFDKKAISFFLCAGVAVMCFSCGEQKYSQEKQLDATKQDSVIVPNEVTSNDTFDIEMALNKQESFLNDLKRIHYTKASDTIKYNYLKKKYEDFDKYLIPDDDLEKQKHSVRVKCLEFRISFFEEIIRVDEEIKKMGHKGGFNDKERSQLQESISLYKKRLWLETH